MSALSFAPPRGAPAKGPVHLQGVWLGHQLCDAASGPTQPTGHSALDAQLPGGGWPIGALGAAAYIGRARVVPLRNMGAALSPFNAWLTLQGIETLPLRMDRICDNALALAKHLQSHPKVEWVRYAGLPDHADHALAQKQMGGRASGILSFGLKASDADPRAAGARFLDALQLFTRLVNIGDAKSLATHPASTTHRQLNPEELAKAGVSENMVRLSVGIEHISDLQADLAQALEKV